MTDEWIMIFMHEVVPTLSAGSRDSAHEQPPATELTRQPTPKTDNAVPI